jgi:uncharacterized SAM-binding protein YcdF (DUF218 family)
MFYFLSKTVSVFATPIAWIFIFLFYAWFAKRSIKKNIALAISILLLYFASTPFFVNKLMRWWEVPPVAYSEMGTYDVGVILSGPVRSFKSPKDRVYIARGSDRFLHTADLYRKGIIKNVVITGGYKKIGVDGVANEAEQIKTVLMHSGVPDSVIFLEADAKNTRENAKNAGTILRKRFLGQKYLLVTSAFHMKRALACFKKEKIEVVPFSTDFYTSDPLDKLHFIEFIPTVNSFSAFSILVKEWVGLCIYKFMGYA